MKRERKFYKVGDHVEWNSEAGKVRGVIEKKIVSDINWKGYVHHASKEEPQYIIKSDKTDHIAVHRGSTLSSVIAAKKQKRQKSRSVV